MTEECQKTWAQTLDDLDNWIWFVLGCIAAVASWRWQIELLAGAAGMAWEKARRK